MVKATWENVTPRIDVKRCVAEMTSHFVVHDNNVSRSDALNFPSHVQ